MTTCLKFLPTSNVPWEFYPLCKMNISTWKLHVLEKLYNSYFSARRNIIRYIEYIFILIVNIFLQTNISNILLWRSWLITFIHLIFTNNLNFKIILFKFIFRVWIILRTDYYYSSTILFTLHLCFVFSSYLVNDISELYTFSVLYWCH